ncbi:hypothetical protein DDQ50_07435 [Amnibacterium flavum]|uniref:FHA domain-containing protein n=2 Tax=Amnibacterium flavum TaxID=2173173 RepID=A0A2V1HUH9_9MICO|nr:hypothetical protein DDQ50_07435 [Amnibacterium flavum]
MFCGECGSAVTTRAAVRPSMPPIAPVPPARHSFASTGVQPVVVTPSTVEEEPSPDPEPAGNGVVPEAGVDETGEDGDQRSTRVVDLLENDEQWQPESLAGAHSFPPAAAAQPDIDEATRMPERARPPAARFGLHFSTGESVTVEGTGLIGRRPMAQPGEYFDHYVTIDDPGRSVSKTHLEFGQEGGAFWISDRYSANGTVVREPDRPPRMCPAGMRSRVTRGARVEIGEQFFLVS